jgi:hypothetical protein
MTIVFAHAGHWLVQLLYALPLVVMFGFLAAGRIRQRREERASKRNNGPSA